jgi:biotin synthase-like enzyme
MLKLFDGFKLETQNLLKAVQTQEDQLSKITSRIEEVRKETNKKVVTLINEIEKTQASIDRKLGVDEFNTRIETKLDKNSLVHVLN